MAETGHEKTSIIADLPVFSKWQVATLNRADIFTMHDFFERAYNPRRRKILARETGIAMNILLRWAIYADLMRVSSLTVQDAVLLLAVNVSGVAVLSKRHPAFLFKAVQKYEVPRGSVITRKPSGIELTQWRLEARKLSPRLRV